MRIGVISDTHGLLRPQALELLRETAHILHAGDIGAPEVVEQLERLAPVTAIRGNVDTGGWAAAYPDRARLTLADRSILLLHDVKALDLDPAREGIQIVVSGHSHRPSARMQDGVLYLNPGSAGPRRFTLPICLATLDLEADPLQPELHRIDP